MNILKERDMNLLSRKRVAIMLDNQEGTPSRLSLLKEVAKHFKTKEDLIVIKHVYPQFGKHQTKLIVHIYDDMNKMKMFEHKNLLKKHKPTGKPAESPSQKYAELAEPKAIEKEPEQKLESKKPLEEPIKTSKE